MEDCIHRIGESFFKDKGGRENNYKYPARYFDFEEQENEKRVEILTKMFRNQFHWQDLTLLPFGFLDRFAKYFDLSVYHWYEHFIEIRNKSNHKQKEVDDIYRKHFKSPNRKDELAVDAVFYLINVSNFVDNEISSKAAFVQQNETVATEEAKAETTIVATHSIDVSLSKIKHSDTATVATYSKDN